MVMDLVPKYIKGDGGSPRRLRDRLPLSQYLARLVREQVQADWPEGYLSAVIGCCADDPLQELDDEPPVEITLQSP